MSHDVICELASFHDTGGQVYGKNVDLKKLVKKIALCSNRKFFKVILIRYSFR